MKKCLLCKSIFNNNEKLKQNYGNYHNVDKNNYFFKNYLVIKKTIFHQKSVFVVKNFKLLRNLKEYMIFKKNYVDGKNDLSENKPTDILNFGNIRTYEISVSKHSSHYDF